MDQDINDGGQKQKLTSKESFSKDGVKAELDILNRLKIEKPELFELCSGDVEKKEAALTERAEQERTAEELSTDIEREAIQEEVSQLRAEAKAELNQTEEKLFEDALTGRKALDRWKVELEQDLDKLITDASLIEERRDTVINRWENQKTAYSKYVEAELKKINTQLEIDSKLLKKLGASKEQLNKKIQAADDERNELFRVREDFDKKHKKAALVALKELYTESQELNAKKEKLTEKLEEVNEDIERIVDQTKEMISQREKEISEILDKKVESAKEAPKLLYRGERKLLEERIEIQTEPVIDEAERSVLRILTSGKDNLVQVSAELKQLMKRFLPLKNQSGKESISEPPLGSETEPQITETREIKIEDLVEKPKSEQESTKQIPLKDSIKSITYFVLVEPALGALSYLNKMAIRVLPKINLSIEGKTVAVETSPTESVQVPAGKNWREKLSLPNFKLPNWVSVKNAGMASITVLPITLFAIASYKISKRNNNIETPPIALTMAPVEGTWKKPKNWPLSREEQITMFAKEKEKKAPKEPEQSQAITPVIVPKPDEKTDATVIAQKPKENTNEKQIIKSKKTEEKKINKKKKKSAKKIAKKNNSKQSAVTQTNLPVVKTDPVKAYTDLVNGWFGNAIKDLSAKKPFFGLSQFEKALAVLGSLKSAEANLTPKQKDEVNKALLEAKQKTQKKDGKTVKLKYRDVNRIAKALRKQHIPAKSEVKKKTKSTLAKAAHVKEPKTKKETKLKKDKKKDNNEKSKKKPEQKKAEVIDLKTELAKQVTDFGSAVEEIKGASRRELGLEIFKRLKEAREKADEKGIKILNKVLTHYVATGYPSRRGLENVKRAAENVIKSHEDTKKEKANAKAKEAEKRRKQEEQKQEAERKQKEAEKKRANKEKAKKAETAKKEKAEEPASVVPSAVKSSTKVEVPSPYDTSEMETLLKRLNAAEKRAGIN